MSLGGVEWVPGGLCVLETGRDARADVGSLPQRGEQELPHIRAISLKRGDFAASGFPRLVNRDEKARIVAGLEQIADVPCVTGGLLTFLLGSCGIFRFFQAEAEAKRGTR